MPTTKLFYETNQIDLAATSTAYKLRDLRGGEVILIKAKNGNSSTVFIGDVDVSTSKGFELSAGQGIKIRLDAGLGAKQSIALYACASTAGDDVVYFMLPYALEVSEG